MDRNILVGDIFVNLTSNEDSNKQQKQCFDFRNNNSVHKSMISKQAIATPPSGNRQQKQLQTQQKQEESKHIKLKRCKFHKNKLESMEELKNYLETKIKTTPKDIQLNENKNNDHINAPFSNYIDSKNNNKIVETSQEIDNKEMAVNSENDENVKTDTNLLIAFFENLTTKRLSQIQDDTLVLNVSSAKTDIDISKNCHEELDVDMVYVDMKSLIEEMQLLDVDPTNEQCDKLVAKFLSRSNSNTSEQLVNSTYHIKTRMNFSTKNIDKSIVKRCEKVNLENPIYETIPYIKKRGHSCNDIEFPLANQFQPKRPSSLYDNRILQEKTNTPLNENLKFPRERLSCISKRTRSHDNLEFLQLSRSVQSQPTKTVHEILF